MKAERKQPEFEPVIITLESEDELYYLWHCLNLNKLDVKELSGLSTTPFPENLDEIWMFQALDKIVRPEKHK
jgi:hypothetical protein